MDADARHQVCGLPVRHFMARRCREAFGCCFPPWSWSGEDGWCFSGPREEGNHMLLLLKEMGGWGRWFPACQWVQQQGGKRKESCSPGAETFPCQISGSWVCVARRRASLLHQEVWAVVAPSETSPEHPSQGWGDLGPQ